MIRETDTTPGTGRNGDVSSFLLASEVAMGQMCAEPGRWRGLSAATDKETEQPGQIPQGLLWGGQRDPSA